MLRITELKLPLEHPPEALHAAILTRLGISRRPDLTEFSVFKRSYDARKSMMVLTYIVDLDVASEEPSC